METNSQSAPPNIAIFCDFENVALGAAESHFGPFKIGLVLERLLDKGKIISKTAYADWERYAKFRKAMHEASFELVEIPHVSYSGKNSADIRLVVDALDLSYTKTHIDVFVIISGDSDFSPLVSKLRENNKMVIGIGVKQSSSDLLVSNCDEFIYYDDLVRTGNKGEKSQGRRNSGRKESGTKAAEKQSATKTAEKAHSATDTSHAPTKGAKQPQAQRGRPKATPEPATSEADKGDINARQEEAIEMVLDTVEALFRDRDDNLWGSMVKQTLKRKRPNFSESFHGYRTFNELLKDAQRRGLLELQKDERSGGFLVLGFGPNA